MHPYDYEVALWVKAAVQQIPFETDEARRGATESGACTTSQLDSARCCLAVNTLERHELSRHFTLLMIVDEMSIPSFRAFHMYST